MNDPLAGPPAPPPAGLLTPERQAYWEMVGLSSRTASSLQDLATLAGVALDYQVTITPLSEIPNP